MKETTLRSLFRANPELPHVALSIRQPWAHFILTGLKPVENRTWKTNFCGPVLIHAAQRVDDIFDGSEEFEVIERETGKKFAPFEVDIGGIVGVAEVVDCVTSHPSPWFSGPFGFVFANPIRLPFVPLKGKLRFFRV